jgi:hypothetical protein
MIDELFALMRSNHCPCNKKGKEIHDLYCFFFPFLNRGKKLENFCFFIFLDIQTYKDLIFEGFVLFKYSFYSDKRIKSHIVAQKHGLIVPLVQLT